MITAPLRIFFTTLTYALILPWAVLIGLSEGGPRQAWRGVCEVAADWWSDVSDAVREGL